MFSLSAECSFDSAHFLKGYEGKCANIHGHRWRVLCEVSGETLQNQGVKKGMLIDFGDLKQALKMIIDPYDHALIYEKGSLKNTTLNALKEEAFSLVEVDFRPTAECFALFFYEELEKRGFSVSALTVYETPTNSATYRR